jgi:glycosyltransferase involved in cell wall biosynthesis
VPTMFAPHAWSFEAATGVLARISRAWEHWATRWTTLLVCVSEGELAVGHLVGIRTDAVVIHNGVDLDRFAPRDRSAARRQLELDAAPTAVCVGRLSDQKGQDRLLDAWPAVRAQVQDARLVLVGEGPNGPDLRARAVEGVKFAGSASNPVHYYASANIVAMASRWEADALVVKEAMASGRSLVAVDVAGLRSALGATGTVVPQDDLNGLVAALVARLEDPTAADADGQRARQIAESEHGIDRALTSWHDVITAIVNRNLGSSAVCG